MAKTSQNLVWVGMGLILATGLIHVIEVPDAIHEALYKGVLFGANGLAAVAAAFGISQGRRWGWVLGLMVAVGSILGYVASRTVGLPGIPAEPDEWLEPLGVASLIVEGLFVLAYLKASKDN